MNRRALLLAALFFAVIVLAQKPEYDFYPEFRNTFTPNLRAQNPTVNNEQILQAYAASLKNQGVTDTEIARRTRLVDNERPQMEADYWNRIYTQGKANYNHAPNGFLVQVVVGRSPGAAPDYAMGDGRNALYLAKLGWRVWGFDPAAAGVDLAQKRARELGLTLNTAAVRDSEYDFGKERFDLILFSWSMPLVPIQKVIDSLKPGGIVVMECAVDFVGRNGMLKMFDLLRIEHYEIVKATADFYDRREIEVLRMIARKP